MAGWTATALIVVNLGLIFLLIAAPLGIRTVSRSVRIKAPPTRVWNAVYPLGDQAGWSGEIASAEAVEGQPDQVRLVTDWEGRDGQPIHRVEQLSNVAPGQAFAMRVVEDSSLDAGFWATFSQRVVLEPEGEGVRLTISQTDSYRGAAFLVFRSFALRRMMAKLKRWAETGEYRRGGMFEHPLTQVAMAAASVMILWSLTGFTVGGLAFAVMITVVVALHELGHMAAFRVAGHRRTRMIFIPLLGGIAIGGRPYNSHFEVAFVALMGAGFSAFLVPPLVQAGVFAAASGNVHGGNFMAALVGCIALFNLANLVPVWKFDGGQVLRQICPQGLPLAASSFALFGLFLGVGWLAGFSSMIVLIAGGVFAALSLMTSGNAVKPRHALVPLDRRGRVALAAALVAVVFIHGSGVIWAFSHFA
ncbi:SRPBCC family protein [Mesorhizobium australicum]|uniref:Zn-dependent protease (Includes SpoIVFB) n=1 Tax=Mesorhizobium australicum TaxID=536018 RepID=A0A1X7PAB8_9HYPH|nr:SRPBCC family protein [Mesorhizobium australicum]SMH47096.1 Zn-dependent protease (includes SpoIVFB) [Mesorhizobium australicum]